MGTKPPHQQDDTGCLRVVSTLPLGRKVFLGRKKMGWRFSGQRRVTCGVVQAWEWRGEGGSSLKVQHWLLKSLPAILLVQIQVDPQGLQGCYRRKGN